MKAIRAGLGRSVVLVGSALALSGCGKSTEQIGTLHVENVEIVDPKGTTKMNVADRINALDQRVQKLEAALEKMREERATLPATVVTPPSPTPKAVTPVPPPRPPPTPTPRPAKDVPLGF